MIHNRKSISFVWNLVYTECYNYHLMKEIKIQNLNRYNMNSFFVIVIYGYGLIFNTLGQGEFQIRNLVLQQLKFFLVSGLVKISFNWLEEDTNRVIRAPRATLSR